MGRMLDGDIARDATSRLGAMGVAPDEGMRADAGKVPMGEAGYQQAQTPEQSCASCVHFDGMASCDVVAGQIDPNGVSTLWEPAAAPMTAQPSPAAP